MADNTHFENHIYPVVHNYARKVFGIDEELISIALVLSWWMWRSRKEDFPAGQWARLAVKQAKYGRDLPGVCSSKTQDAYRLERLEVQGGDMGGLADTSLTPLEDLSQREQAEIFYASLSERESLMAKYFWEGLENQEVAQALSVTPGAVTHKRRALAERFKNQK